MEPIIGLIKSAYFWVKNWRKTQWLLVGVVIALLGSYLWQIAITHQARLKATALFNQTQAVLEAKDEWTRLALELTHLSDPIHVSRVAQQALKMREPKAHEIIILDLRPQADPEQKPLTHD